MRQPLPHILNMAVGRPLCVQPEKLSIVLQVLRQDRFSLELPAISAAAPARGKQNKPYVLTGAGTAILPVAGLLTKRTLFGSEIDALCGITSYAAIAASFADALQDPGVRGILLDVDSPGGECVGLFELCDQIYSARGQKPIYAVANDLAASAAYAIASAADRVFVTRMGAVGSVGVFACHVDESRADAKAGFNYEFVYAGARKIDGNAHQPLSEQAQETLQAEVDRIHGVFCDTVARNRRVPVAKIQDTEADVFFADSALPLLADQVGTTEDATAAMEGKGGARQSTGSKKALANPSAAREKDDFDRVLQYCELAGRPEKALEYVGSKMNSDEVLKDLVRLHEEDEWKAFLEVSGSFASSKASIN